MLEEVMGLVNRHLNNVLLSAEAAMPGDQFQAFRKITLNEFGKCGLLAELERLFIDEEERDGKGRK